MVDIRKVENLQQSLSSSKMTKLLTLLDAVDAIPEIPQWYKEWLPSVASEEFTRMSFLYDWEQANLTDELAHRFLKKDRMALVGDLVLVEKPLIEFLAKVKEEFIKTIGDLPPAGDRSWIDRGIPADIADWFTRRIYGNGGFDAYDWSPMQIWAIREGSTYLGTLRLKKSFAAEEDAIIGCFGEQFSFRDRKLVWRRHFVPPPGGFPPSAIVFRKQLSAKVDAVSNKPQQADKIYEIRTIIKNKLRKGVHEKPTKEKNILDVLETLFIGAGLDKEFTREKEHIQYSTKSYVPDFVFKEANTAIEVKLCDTSKKEKQIIDEMNADIAGYQSRYFSLIFVVYDLGCIRDVDSFKRSFEEHAGVEVFVVKH